MAALDMVGVMLIQYASVKQDTLTMIVARNYAKIIVITKAIATMDNASVKTVLLVASALSQRVQLHATRMESVRKDNVFAIRVITVLIVPIDNV